MVRRGTSDPNACRPHLDVQPCLCARFNEIDIQLPGLCIALFDRHLPAARWHTRAAKRRSYKNAHWLWSQATPQGLQCRRAPRKTARKEQHATADVSAVHQAAKVQRPGNITPFRGGALESHTSRMLLGFAAARERLLCAYDACMCMQLRAPRRAIMHACMHAWRPTHLCMCLHAPATTIPATAPPAPLVDEVRLVAHEENDNVIAPLRPHLLNPPRRVQERLPVCTEERAGGERFSMQKPVALTGTAAAVGQQSMPGGARDPQALTGDVIDDHCYRRVPNVRRYQTAKALLSCCIPAVAAAQAKAPSLRQHACTPYGSPPRQRKLL